MNTQTAQRTPNTVGEEYEKQLPEPVARRGISEAQWRTLKDSLYPGARSQSILLVWDYCKARKLDPLKKPCHIVPMQVQDPESGHYVWRDVVMPGIYEYRTTAQRTGEYLGHSKPAYGPEINFKGVVAPEYCEMVMYRWNADAKQKVEFPVRVYFREAVATKKDGSVNAMWTRRPIGQLTKCTEAAGLREAFPDELGGEPTAEEMDGKFYDADDSPPSPSEKTAALDEKIGIRQEVDETVEQDTQPEQPDESGPPDFQAVMEQISKAQNGDDVDAALDLSRELPDDQQVKLAKMAESRKQQLEEREQA